MRSSFGARMALLAAIALAVRLLYILVVAPAPVGVGGDAGFYHSAANQIADGHFYYRVIFGHPHATAEHPPLYPLLLSVVSSLGGVSLLAHRLVGCLVGTASVVLIGLLARRALGARAGVIAASIAAVYPPLLTADGLLMSEPLFVLLIAGALLLADRIATTPTVRGCALLGATLGLATLTRSEALILLPLLAWPAVWARRPQRGLRLALVTASSALVIAPWVAHNWAVFGRPLLATDSSTVIAGANCRDAYYGRDIGWWSLTCLAHGRTHAQLLAGDASSAPGLRYARAHISRLPLLAAVRTLRTFDLYQPLRQGNREPRRRWVDVIGVALYYPILALAAVGLTRRRQRRWLWLAPVWMTVIVSILGWGIGRFRVAADVSLIVLAVSTLVSLRSGRAARA